MLLTCFLTYQGYHGIVVDNLSCASEYLVAVTGTTESTSPLQYDNSKGKNKNKKDMIKLSCLNFLRISSQKVNSHTWKPKFSNQQQSVLCILEELSHLYRSNFDSESHCNIDAKINQLQDKTAISANSFQTKFCFVSH